MPLFGKLLYDITLNFFFKLFDRINSSSSQLTGWWFREPFVTSPAPFRLSQLRDFCTLFAASLFYRNIVFSHILDDEKRWNFHSQPVWWRRQMMWITEKIDSITQVVIIPQPNTMDTRITIRAGEISFPFLVRKSIIFFLKHIS